MSRVLALGLALTGLLLIEGMDSHDWETPNVKAEEFSLKDLDGHLLRSTDLHGKVVVLDFWATWCGPCVREVPDLIAFHESLKARTDVVFLSFNVTDERADVAAFVRQYKTPYPSYMADDLIGPYELFAFPTKLVIDMRGDLPGVVRYRRTGYTSRASLEHRVKAVVEGIGPSKAP
jgi:thiol-disulfide isomerase/thioredoxin